MVIVNPVVDSCMSFAQAVYGSKAPDEIINALCLMDVFYFSFDGRLHRGQLIIHEAAREDMEAVFSIVKKSRFPVAKVIPIVKYLWSDEASMADNNTSAFNYRYIAGTKNLSAHASGLAVDINPVQNPFINSDKKVLPPGAVYHCSACGTLKESHPIVSEFLKRGWQWGGQYAAIKDYHHFEKKMPGL